MPAETTMDEEKKAALQAYAKKVLEQREMEAQLKKGTPFPSKHSFSD